MKKWKICLIMVLHFALDFLVVLLLGSKLGQHSHGLHIACAVAFAAVCVIVDVHKHKSKE